MNTKSMLLGALLAGAVFFGISATYNETTVPGRYQLASATIQVSERQEPGLFKIDTSTGRVWHLISIEGKIPELPGPERVRVDGWDEISESLVEAIKIFQRKSPKDTREPLRQNSP